MKPAHILHFSEKHDSDPSKKMYRISTTCAD